MTQPRDTPVVPSAAGAPTPEDGAELRRRLARLVARHGTAIGTDPEAHRECEVELSPLYGGAYAVRAWAVVQTLKGGYVDALVRWSHAGTPGGFDELARQLSARSGVALPIAEWALCEWLSQLRRDVSRPTPGDAAASPDRPTASPATSSPTVVRAAEPRRPATIALESLPGPDVFVRIPHLVLGGLAFSTVLAVATMIWRPGVPGVGVPGEAAASTPALPPAPDIDEGFGRGRGPLACQSSSEPDRPPRALQGGAVPVPGDALAAGIDEGWATLRMRIDAEGRVEVGSIEVVDASHPALAESATEMAERLRYRPARRDGCAVPATVSRTLRFSADADPLG